jgi:hypothetical protein
MSFASLCIPRVTQHCSVENVRDVFNQLFDGEFVENIDTSFTTDSKGEVFQVMFVHFRDVPANEHTVAFYAKMEEEKMVKVMTGYKKYFWKVFLNRKKERQGAHIMTKEEEEELANRKGK